VRTFSMSVAAIANTRIRSGGISTPRWQKVMPPLSPSELVLDEAGRTTRSRWPMRGEMRSRVS
jgi:hypothetical protein